MTYSVAVPRQVGFGRLIATVTGGALLAAALGLWFVPGSNWEAEMRLMKLGLTIAFLISGSAALIWRVPQALHDRV